jgi:hypothetical protein
VTAYWIFLYAHASHGPKISCNCMGAAGVYYDCCELALDLVDVGWPVYLSAICRQRHLTNLAVILCTAGKTQQDNGLCVMLIVCWCSCCLTNLLPPFVKAMRCVAIFQTSHSDQACKSPRLLHCCANQHSHFDLMAHGEMLSACSSSGLVSVTCERKMGC